MCAIVTILTQVQIAAFFSLWLSFGAPPPLYFRPLLPPPQKYLAPQLVFLSDDPNDRDALYNSMRIYGTILLLFLALIVFVGVKFVSLCIYSLHVHRLAVCPVGCRVLNVFLNGRWLM